MNTIGLIMRDPLASEVIRRVKEATLSVLPDAEIILYGSRARGDAREESDWDFLVVTDAPRTFDTEERLREPIDDLSFELNTVIMAFVENRAHWEESRGVSPFLRNVVREGVPV